MPLPTPIDLGPYQATRLLSSGGQASVWLADGPHGEVAVKVARDEEQIPAIRREIEILGQFASRGLVRMVEFDPGGRWVALERVRGLPIDQWAVNRPDAEIVRVADDLLSVLSDLHETGVIHGDLKPENLMVDQEGRPRILDLGIATLPGDKVEGFRGTLGYAAPEILQGKPPSQRSDLYAVGAVLYRCLAGRDPFEVADPAALTYLPMVTLPLPPSTWRPGLSRRLEHFVLSLLSRDAARRPVTAARAREMLYKALEGEPARWVLGMTDERDRLARAVVGAADGETRIVVVYGPPGSGRRTLIAEASDAARRLGLESLKLADLGEKDLTRTVRGGQPVVLVARAKQRRATDVAKAFQKGRIPGLILLHSERPVPSLGEAIQMTPPPLQPSDIAALARHMRVDPELAEDAWARWAGHPAAVIGALRAALPDFDPADTRHLPSESKQILDHLSEQGPAEVSALAGFFRVDPHTLLDHCAVLLAEGRISASEDGLRLFTASDLPTDPGHA